MGPKRTYYEVLLHKANTGRLAGIEGEDPNLIPNDGNPASKMFMSMDPKVFNPGKSAKVIRYITS